MVYEFITQTFRTHKDTNNKSIYSVTHLRKSGNIYYMNESGEVFVLSRDSLQNRQKLLTIKSSSQTSRLTVNDKHLVVSNADGHRLMTYNLSTMLKTSHLLPKLSSWIRSLAFHPDGDLVLLGYDNKISKYRLSDTKDPELVWECTEVSEAYALCVDEMRGLVYVIGKGHIVYIIQGGKINYQPNRQGILFGSVSGSLVKFIILNEPGNKKDD